MAHRGATGGRRLMVVGPARVAWNRIRSRFPKATAEDLVAMGIVGDADLAAASRAEKGADARRNAARLDRMRR